jgi:hypothetical protein
METGAFQDAFDRSFSTPPAPPAHRKAEFVINGGHLVALKWTMKYIYGLDGLTSSTPCVIHKLRKSKLKSSTCAGGYACSYVIMVVVSTLKPFGRVAIHTGVFLK